MKITHIALWTNNLEQLRDFYCNFFDAKSNESVDLLTEQFRESGYKVISEPRYTGDGFYESAINDPDGNIVEITI